MDQFALDVVVDKELVDRALREIFLFLRSREPAEDPGLLSGGSGHALFYWYLAKRLPDLVPAEVIDSCVNQIQRTLPSDQRIPTLGSGLAGIGSMLEVLLQEADEPYDGAYNDNTDRILCRELEDRRWNGELEYVLGLSGVAVYAARRSRIGRGLALYSRIIDLLEQRALHTAADRCTWSTPIASRYRIRESAPAGDPEFNLGLAHGVPAIVSALLPALGHEPLRARVETLIEYACNWIVDQARNPQEYGSHFACYVGQNSGSRLGWCYGDLAVATVLARAAATMGNARLLASASRFGDSAAGRLSRSSAQVSDAAICHGSAGLALMFRNLHSFTGGAKLLKASQYWVDDLQNNYSSFGLRGFDTSVVSANGATREMIPMTGLLEGYAGTGLALLAFVGVEPSWLDLVLLGKQQSRNGTEGLDSARGRF